MFGGTWNLWNQEGEQKSVLEHNRVWQNSAEQCVQTLMSSAIRSVNRD